MNIQNAKIGIIGLGYVGLPLAVEFGKQRPVLGFDVKAGRIAELQAGQDSTLEVSAAELREAAQLSFSSDAEDLKSCQVFIVTVPTPVDAANRPDMTPLIRASETVGRALSKNAVVIYESTVYPGATEEVCVPVLEKFSGLKFNVDFFCGYSPERINPGDKEHRLPSIRKITSGSTSEVADAVDGLYAQIITAGTHKAGSIKVAEAAKVIENIQRDVNIALMNELSLIFHRLGIDTLQVLQAAGTKWNFLPFRPGLVGGHCIGVDPYYLTHKAQVSGYTPQLILAGRRVNDGMGRFVADRAVKTLIRTGRAPLRAKAVVLGLTFKENCPDLRNSKVIDIVHHLQDYGLEVQLHDPLADAVEAFDEYGVTLTGFDALEPADLIVLAVPHREFLEKTDALLALAKPGAVFADVKSSLPLDVIGAAGLVVWRL
jgi:UDP-N-acetyl-D-galactosamine dehydrogenase